MAMISGTNVLITGGVFSQNVTTNRPGSEILAQHVASNAFHDSAELSTAAKCWPDTRVNILADLEIWAGQEMFTPSIKWLHGEPGKGKTAIMRTTAENLERRTLLAAAFFFSRTGERCNNAAYLIPTLAYQIARSIPGTRQSIEDAVAENPFIFTKSLVVQSQRLIIDPIQSAYKQGIILSNYPRLIVIDALDECQSTEQQRDVLMVLHRTLQKLPVVFALLISSRTERHIQALFQTNLKDVASLFHLCDDANSEIEKFRLRRLYSEKLRECHAPMVCYPEPEWPSREVIEVLVEHSLAGGQRNPIYVSAVIRFITARGKDPFRQLDIIMDAIREGASLGQYLTLDMLYYTAFSTIDAVDLHDTLQVLGALLVPIVNRSLFINSHATFWDSFLGFEPGKVDRLLLSLEPLVSRQELYEEDEATYCSNPNIKSLEDFLFDCSRSVVHNLFIDRGMVFENLAKRCVYNLFSPDDITRLFIRRNIKSIFREATPTAELLQAIEAMDLGGQAIVYTGSSYIPPPDLKWVYPSFLEAVRQSKLPGRNELFAKHSYAYNSAVKYCLSTYLKDERLRFLLLAFLSYARDSFFGRLFEDFIDKVCPLSVELERIDKEQGFRLYRDNDCDTYCETESAKFSKTATDLIANIEESKYWYSMASLRLVNCMTPVSGIYVNSRMYLDQGKSPANETTTLGYIAAYILPRLLNTASTQSDLGPYLKNNTRCVGYENTQLKHYSDLEDAIRGYLVDCETHKPSKFRKLLSPVRRAKGEKVRRN